MFPATKWCGVWLTVAMVAAFSAPSSATPEQSVGMLAAPQTTAQTPVVKPRKLSRARTSAHDKRASEHTAGAQPVALTPDEDVPLTPPQSEQEAVEDLERDLALKVGKHRQPDDYPQEALRSGWTGTAVVEVLVAGNGTIKTIALERSSGFKVLDDQALELVRRVSRLWVPTRLRKRDTSVSVPIGFQLQQL